MITQIIGIGIVAGFAFVELTGISAGGVVVPGYLAFYWTQPLRLASTFVTAILSYLLVRGLSRVVILYGRRRFMASVLAGFIIGWGMEWALRRLPPMGQDLRAIGFLIPGLIANDMFRQGILKTILAALVVSGVVRLAMVVLIG